MKNLENGTTRRKRREEQKIKKRTSPKTDYLEKRKSIKNNTWVHFKRSASFVPLHDSQFHKYNAAVNGVEAAPSTQPNTNKHKHFSSSFFAHSLAVCLFRQVLREIKDQNHHYPASERERVRFSFSFWSGIQKKNSRILCAHHFVWTEPFVRIFPFNLRYKWLGAACSTKARLRKWQYHFIAIFLHTPATTPPSIEKASNRK